MILPGNRSRKIQTKCSFRSYSRRISNGLLSSDRKYVIYGTEGRAYDSFVRSQILKNKGKKMCIRNISLNKKIYICIYESRCCSRFVSCFERNKI